MEQALVVASILCFGAVSGCREQVIALEIPGTRGMQSLVLAVEYLGRLEVTAIRLGDPEQRRDLPYIDDLSDDVFLSALLYGEDLEELGLPAGPLDPSDAPRFARPLPGSFSAAFEARVVDGRPEPWLEIQGLDPRLAAFRFRGDIDRCATFDAQIFDLGTRLEITALASVDASSVLVALPSTLYVYDRTGVTSTTAVRGFFAQAAYRAIDGRIWLGGSNGELWVGHPRDGFSLASRSPLGGAIRWLDGPRGSEPFELFTLTRDGGFARFDGSAWTEIPTFARNDPERENKDGGLLWIGPRRALAVPPQDPAFAQYYFAYDDGAVTAGTIVTAIYGEITSLAHSKTLGPLILTELSHIFMYSPEAAIGPLEGAPVLSAPKIIAPFGDGFVYAGGGVTYDQYVPEVGFCPSKALPLSLQPFVIAPFESGFAMTGDAVDREDETPLLILTPM